MQKTLFRCLTSLCSEEGRPSKDNTFLGFLHLVLMGRHVITGTGHTPFGQRRQPWSRTKTSKFRNNMVNYRNTRTSTLNWTDSAPKEETFYSYKYQGQRNTPNVLNSLHYTNRVTKYLVVMNFLALPQQQQQSYECHNPSFSSHVD